MAPYIFLCVPHYITISELLQKLTKKDVSWKWSYVEQKAFTKLKKILIGARIMVYFKPNKQTNIIINLSLVGMGAMLTQEHKVICCTNRVLMKAKQCYFQTQIEMLMVVYAVEHFCLYLFGSKFRIITDYKPFIGIDKSQKSCKTCREHWRLWHIRY